MCTSGRRFPGILAAACLLAATTIGAAAPRAAEACAMAPRPRLRSADSERYLAAALRHFEKGEVELAVFEARRLLRVPRIRARQRAQALTISSWAAWQRGETAAAVTTLKLARALDADGGAVEVVLAMAVDRQLTARLRRAAVS